MSSSRPQRHLLWQRAFGLLFLSLIGLSLLGAQQSPVAHSLQAGERVSTLMFGVDAVDKSPHTDTLIVSVFDPIKNSLSLLSIPRDTRINLPGYRFNRINEIYGYFLRTTNDRDRSCAEVRGGVQYLLSTAEVPVAIPYFVQVDFSGFRKMVDLLGGVWVTIKHPMDYDDNAGNYHFHKQPGRYLMQGDEALRYVRFRGHTSDRVRIFRQHEFLRSMILRLVNPLTVFRLPEMVAAGLTSVRSNLSLWDFLYLASAARRIRSDDVGFYILPGEMSGPYWKPKEDMAKNLASMLVRGTSFQEAESDVIAPQSDRITVKIWNASGKRGMGYKMTRYLRKCGYDVVDWGNYTVDQIQTRVIDRTGRIANAQAVAESLGVNSYHSEPNPSAFVDVEVIVGENYQGVDAPAP